MWRSLKAICAQALGAAAHMGCSGQGGGCTVPSCCFLEDTVLWWINGESTEFTFHTTVFAVYHSSVSQSFGKCNAWLRWMNSRFFKRKERPSSLVDPVHKVEWAEWNSQWMGSMLSSPALNGVLLYLWAELKSRGWKSQIQWLWIALKLGFFVLVCSAAEMPLFCMGSGGNHCGAVQGEVQEGVWQSVGLRAWKWEHDCLVLTRETALCLGNSGLLAVWDSGRWYHCTAVPEGAWWRIWRSFQFWIAFSLIPSSPNVVCCPNLAPD